MKRKRYPKLKGEKLRIAQAIHLGIFLGMGLVTKSKYHELSLEDIKVNCRSMAILYSNKIPFWFHEEITFLEKEIFE